MTRLALRLVRPDASRCTGSARRPGDARVRVDAARHRSARLAQGSPPPRGLPRRERATPRLRTRRRSTSSRRWFATTGAASPKTSEPRFGARSHNGPGAVAQARGALAPRRRARPRPSWCRRGSPRRRRRRPRHAPAPGARAMPSSSSGVRVDAATCSRRFSTARSSSRSRPGRTSEPRRTSLRGRTPGPSENVCMRSELEPAVFGNNSTSSQVEPVGRTNPHTETKR